MRFWHEPVVLARWLLTQASRRLWITVGNSVRCLISAEFRLHSGWLPFPQVLIPNNLEQNRKTSCYLHDNYMLSKMCVYNQTKSLSVLCSLYILNRKEKKARKKIKLPKGKIKDRKRGVIQTPLCPFSALSAHVGARLWGLASDMCGCRRATCAKPNP